MSHMHIFSIMMLLASLLITPNVVLAACHLEGPHNCAESNEEQLVAITKNTIHNMHLTEVHPFRTENDTILEAYARNHAQLAAPDQDSRYMNPIR